MNFSPFIITCHFIKFITSNVCFNKKGLAILLVLDNPSMLRMILLIKLTAHPFSLLFAD